MTYCLGMNLDAGMVFVADSRTNAGVDNIARFDKMRVFAREGDRVIVTLSSGNLSVTQHALNLLEQGIRHAADDRHLLGVRSMFDVATLVGNAMREVQRRDGDYMRQHKIDPSASFIVGGQIQSEEPRLYLVYSEGNFIESSSETRFFQIGETKYGKPILDRVIVAAMPLADALKCALVSFDSTMRSNVSVGPPLHVLVYRANSFQSGTPLRLDETDPYFVSLRAAWGDGLKQVFAQLPPLPEPN